MGNNKSYLKTEEKVKEKFEKEERKFLIKDTKELFKNAVKEDSKKNYPVAFTYYRQGVENVYYLLRQSKDEKFKAALWKCSKEYVQRALYIDIYLEKNIRNTPTIPTNSQFSKKIFKDDFVYEGFTSKEDREILKGLQEKCVKNCSHLSWDDVVGLEDVKESLKTQFIWPIIYPDLVTSEQGCEGMLLYGLPGTGKTFVAQCAAGEIPGLTFFNFGTSELKSKWQGGTERATAMMFEMARQRQPSIIFIDEADSLFAKRDGDKSGTDVAGALLKGMSSHQGGIYIIAATNFPDRIDSAFFRRFTTKIYIPMPTKLDRMKILQKLHNDFCKTKPEGISDLVPSDFEWLAAKTEDYSSGDLETFMKRLHSEPFTSLRRDKYFRRSESSENVWVPCTKFEEGAEEHHWEKLRGKGAKIQLPPFRRYHMINVLEKVRPSMPDKTIVESVNRFKQQYAIQK